MSVVLGCGVGLWCWVVDVGGVGLWGGVRREIDEGLESRRMV